MSDRFVVAESYEPNRFYVMDDHTTWIVSPALPTEQVAQELADLLNGNEARRAELERGC